MRSLRFGIGDELPQVPAKRVDLFDMAIGHGEFLGFLADAGEIAAGGRFIGRTAVVVAELDQDVVAGFQIGGELVPEDFVEEGPGAAAGAGAIHDADLFGVEVIREGIAPAFALRVAGGGIAGDEDGGHGLTESCPREDEYRDQALHGSANARTFEPAAMATYCLPSNS